MSGGLGYRKFYIAEVGRLTDRQKDNLPEFSYTAEEIEAGFEKINKAFGFSSTLRNLEAKTPYKRSELLTWSVYDFHAEIAYFAWEADAQKKYNEIMIKKQP